MDANQLSHKIIGLAIEVHRHLGPGLLESAYSECLAYEISNSGLYVEREKLLPISYKGIFIHHGYRLDLLVENKLVLELKTTDELTDVHHSQLITYLKLGNYPLGLLINFNTRILKDGLKRVINSGFVNSHPTDG
ncbi:GxxExxY protein [Flavobacterium rivuli WB 3.3-2 = DSM 21788]|uniref:GxxExxY protein n=1 Tax=Flavobacterium rivuli WB 3.3-2 = DSM 21788 TaxID=1121895 RepID=A0A0A2M965_9FLAO|nr:GxxExxY protein [Flavobacterium rivuli]KGO88003.1 GxxExxY protein [Flavobacterium rivuli WB 3.3-2 = DSM 21788]